MPLPVPPPAPCTTEDMDGQAKRPLKTPGLVAGMRAGLCDERAALRSLDRWTGTRGATGPGITETVLLRSTPAPLLVVNCMVPFGINCFFYFH